MVVAKTAERTSILKRMNRYRFFYLLLLPAIVLHFVFHYLPMAGVIVAFQNYDITKGIMGSNFIGFKNFVDIFTKPGFSDKLMSAALNTLHYSVLVLFFGTPFPIALAILLNELRSNILKKVSQTISYLPHFLSWVAVSGMFYSIFATYGIWNDLVEKLFAVFGLAYERKNILMDYNNFPAIIFWTNLWKTLGWSSIIYLSAVTGVNQELYDAAVVDGCNRFGKIIHVTLPGIMPTVIIVFIMSFGGLFSSNFDQVFNLQNAYVQEKTEIIGTLTYRFGIQQAKYSFATAFSLIQGILSFVLTFSVNKISKSVSGIGIW